MAKVYSQDLRERLIGAVEAGQSASAASRIFKVSRSIAIKWVAHRRRTGEVRISVRHHDRGGSSIDHQYGRGPGMAVV